MAILAYTRGFSGTSLSGDENIRLHFYIFLSGRRPTQDNTWPSRGTVDVPATVETCSRHHQDDLSRYSRHPWRVPDVRERGQTAWLEGL